MRVTVPPLTWFDKLTMSGPTPLTWFDKLTMSGPTPLTLSLSKGALTPSPLMGEGWGEGDGSSAHVVRQAHHERPYPAHPEPVEGRLDPLSLDGRGLG